MRRELKKPISPQCQKKIERLKVTEDDKKTLTRIIFEPIAYIPNNKFSQRSQMEPIMRTVITIEAGQPIGAEEERNLFIQMNYARYQLCQMRRALLRRKSWRIKDVRQLIELYKFQLENRSKIVTGNMGLVLSMVQKIDYRGVEYTDLVSEGSMALLRSVEKFDYARGFKFSTYACRAIFKGFARAAKQSYRYRSLFPAQLDTAMEKDDYLIRHHLEEQKDLQDEFQTIIRENLANLSDIEKSVVQLRFSLGGQDEPGPQTLKEIGQRLGLTKERIRQIQNKALMKLRMVAEDRLLAS